MARKFFLGDRLEKRSIGRRYHLGFTPPPARGKTIPLALTISRIVSPGPPPCTMCYFLYCIYYTTCNFAGISNLNNINSWLGGGSPGTSGVLRCSVRDSDSGWCHPISGTTILQYLLCFLLGNMIVMITRSEGIPDCSLRLSEEATDLEVSSTKLDLVLNWIYP